MRGRSDVLVIGAGPAGCAAGIELARAGARVTVVDRAVFPRDKTCGDALSNRAVRIVAELGASLERVPHATVKSSAAVFPDGHRIRRSYGEAPGLIVGRRDLDQLLRTTLEQSGAQVLEGVGVHALAPDRRGRARAEGDDGFAWDAGVVIAADGPASVAWTALGRRAPRGARLALAATAYYEGVRYDAAADGESEHYFEADLACGYAWAFPAVDGVANVGVYQRADRYRSGGARLRELLDAFVARHPERFAGARRVGAVRTWPLPLAGLRPFAGGPGVLACGDAARLVDPLSGEGIWHALHSGRLAAGAALGALARGRLDGAQLRRYALRLGREIAWPSAARLGVQAGLEPVVARELYRAPAVRALLDWGFTRGALEPSKQFDRH